MRTPKWCNVLFPIIHFTLEKQLGSGTETARKASLTIVWCRTGHQALQSPQQGEPEPHAPQKEKNFYQTRRLSLITTLYTCINSFIITRVVIPSKESVGQ